MVNNQNKWVYIVNNGMLYSLFLAISNYTIRIAFGDVVYRENLLAAQSIIHLLVMWIFFLPFGAALAYIFWKKKHKTAKKVSL
ncbi:hypothetical protein [Sutcliffiella deserti]|uniref:hypothetical protein n=1 Tax=Sutcliffiella deserti TaxID=2875501 RepID=UPI001CBD6030|nr:hypothetical protein [Sutcliffiella deserti]